MIKHKVLFIYVYGFLSIIFCIFLLFVFVVDSLISKFFIFFNILFIPLSALLLTKYWTRFVFSLPFFLLVDICGLYFKPVLKECDGRFCSIYSGRQYHWYSFWNLIDEKERIKIGYYTFNKTGTPDLQQQRFLDKVLIDYDGIDKIGLGNVHSNLYEMFDYMFGFFGYGNGIHYYFYDSKSDNNNLTIFFHGSAGNFKLYTYWMYKFGEKENMDLIFPSYGFGNRNEGNFIKYVDDTILDAEKRTGKQYNKINLIGISNGGKAVTRYVKNSGRKLNTVVYISPVMDPDLMIQNDYLSAIKNVNKIFVFHGNSDIRIPKKYVEACVKILKKNNILAYVQYFPGDDHFLFLDKKDEILDTLGLSF